MYWWGAWLQQIFCSKILETKLAFIKKSNETILYLRVLDKSTDSLLRNTFILKVHIWTKSHIFSSYMDRIFLCAVFRSRTCCWLFLVVHLHASGVAFSAEWFTFPRQFKIHLCPYFISYLFDTTRCTVQNKIKCQVRFSTLTRWYCVPKQTCSYSKNVRKTSQAITPFDSILRMYFKTFKWPWNRFQDIHSASLRSLCWNF
jgi:hypothetical protein